MEQKGFCDIHNHFLYGIDDGPAEKSGTFDLIEEAYSQGIRYLFSTPHVCAGRRPFDYEAYLSKIDEVSREAKAKYPDLTILTGAEIKYTDQACAYLKENKIPTMNSTNRVLVEFNINITYEDMLSNLQFLLSGGYSPVLAHIERYECLFKHPKKLIDLKIATEVKYQINSETVTSHKGFSDMKFLKTAFGENLVDYIATDAHNTLTRPALMSKAYEKICSSYGDAYADYMFFNLIK